MTKKKKKQNQEKQLELLKNFEGDFYQEKRVGNVWLVKMWNGSNKKWQVAVYSLESYKRYKEFQDRFKRLDYQIAKDD